MPNTTSKASVPQLEGSFLTNIRNNLWSVVTQLVKSLDFFKLDVAKFNFRAVPEESNVTGGAFYARMFC